LKRFILNQSLSHPVRSVILSVVLTLLMGLGIPYVSIDDDLMRLIPDNIESRVLWEHIEEEFGSTDFMYAALGSGASSALTPETVEKLRVISGELEDLPEVEEVISMATMKKIVSEDGFMVVSDLVPDGALSEQDMAEIGDYLRSNELSSRRSLSRDGRYINIMVRPATSVSQSRFATAVLEVIEAHRDGFEVHYGGMAYITGEVPKLMLKDVSILMRAAILIMIVLLYANLRSFPGLMMILITIVLSAASMMGFLGWMYRFSGGSDEFVFSLLNSSMPIIILTITNSYGVHVLTHFFRNMRKLKDRHRAVEETIGNLILPIFMAAITTVIAFMTLIFAPIKPMMGYGLAISVAVLWGLMLSIVLIPSLIILFPWKEGNRAMTRASLLEKVINAFSSHVLAHPAKYFSFGLMVVALSVYGITLINVEVNIMDFLKPGNSIRESMDFLDEHMTGSMNMAMKIEGDMLDPALLKEVEALQEFIAQNPEVTLTASIVDVVKQMHRVVMDDDPAYESIPDEADKVANLFTLYSMSGDPDDFSALLDYDYQNALGMVQLTTISTKKIIRMLEDIETYLAEHVDAERTQIRLTGLMVFLKDFAALVIRSSMISIIASVFLIFVVAWIFFRHYSWGLVAILPLTAAVLLNFGLMGYFGVNMNHVISLLTSIIIGVGVDFAVHYIARFRLFAAQDPDDPELSLKTARDVGYPIALDVVSNLGFAALLFSLLRPLNYMGGLSLFAMFSSSFGTLILLATAIELWKKPLLRIIEKERKSI